MTTQRTTWTDAELEKQLRAACVHFSYFPSAQDLRRIGRNDLAIQVGRRGGYRYWSDRIGIPRNHSDSDTGWDGERTIMQTLQAKGFQVERPAEVKCPYDLRVNEVLRIDVKSAKYAEYGVSCGWFYRIGKHVQADLIVLCQLDTGTFFALPWWACPKTNITLCRGGGIYKPYQDRFDLIKAMIEVRTEERQKIA